MTMLKKLILTTIFSPILLVISIFLLCSQLKQIHCRKNIFLHLNLDIIDKLNIADFANIVCIMLKTQHFRVQKSFCFCANRTVLIAQKSRQKILVSITKDGIANASEIVHATLSDKSCYNCDNAVIVTNAILSKNIIFEAKQNNVQIINRKELEAFLLSFKKHKHLNQK